MAYVRNVERGDSLVLSSAEHNRIANAVNVNNAPSFVSPDRERIQYSVVRLKNGTSSLIPKFRFVKIGTTYSGTSIVPFERVPYGAHVNLSVGYTNENILPGELGDVIVSGIFWIYYGVNSIGTCEFNEKTGLKYAYAIDSVNYVISDGTDVEESYPGAALIGNLIYVEENWGDNGNQRRAVVNRIHETSSGDSELYGEIKERLESGIYVVKAYDRDGVYVGDFYYVAVEMAMATNIVVGSKVVIHRKLARIY